MQYNLKKLTFSSTQKNLKSGKTLEVNTMIDYVGPAYFLGGCGAWSSWGCCGGWW
jgi:hypothetical protein